MATDAFEGERTQHRFHTPLGYQERVLAPELKKAIIDSESRLHAVMQANFEKMERQVAGAEKRIEKWIESGSMEARVESLESRLRDLDNVFRRIAGGA